MCQDDTEARSSQALLAAAVCVDDFDNQQKQRDFGGFLTHPTGPCNENVRPQITGRQRFLRPWQACQGLFVTRPSDLCFGRNQLVSLAQVLGEMRYRLMTSVVQTLYDNVAKERSTNSAPAMPGRQSPVAAAAAAQ